MMIRTILEFLKPFMKPEDTPQRRKLFFDTAAAHIYAIGDVHGCFDALERLETLIVKDSIGRSGPKWLVMLGDYVDRGPSSAAVIERLTAKPPADFERFCLAGNHEEVMLDFLRNPLADHRWLAFGGVETLQSYGIHSLPTERNALRDLLQSRIPDRHRDFLNTLPSLISVPSYCFVHAGLRDGVRLADQQDRDLLWIRPARSDADTANGFVTVHGHTPVGRPQVGSTRINVDTGAFKTGRLSAVRLSHDEAPEILHVDT